MNTPKNITSALRALLFNRSPLAVSRQLRVLGLAIVCLTLAGNTQSFAAKWDPIDPADLASKDSISFPGADAEILLSTCVVDERAQVGGNRTDLALVVDRFVRAKIYTVKGLQDRGRLNIQYLSDSQVTTTEARVVKPNGTSAELKQSDIVESVLTAEGMFGKTKKQIALICPGLEVGDVVEYRWTEERKINMATATFYCQSLLPTREYHFNVTNLTQKFSVETINSPKSTTSEAQGGGFALVMRDLPAFEAEDHMPPANELQSWIYLAKSSPISQADADVWKHVSGVRAEDFNWATKPGAAVKKKAEALVFGAANDEEKLQRLYVFCQSEIFNTTYKTTAKLQDEIDKHEGEDAYAPTKILDRGRGRWDEINLLFASLARGLGFEVKEACNASRDEILNIKFPRGWLFLQYSRVAIKQGEKWTYFNPGKYYVPFGLMPWQDERAIALLCSSKKVEFSEIPSSRADQSEAQRKARLTLDSEGTLEGDVEETFTGHLAEKRKVDASRHPIDEVNKAFCEAKTKLKSNIEITDIVWTNLETSGIPLSVKYHVRVPGYAEQAGKRLIFAPSFFQIGAPAVFAAAERKFPLYFYYPWAEHDDIEIVLPAGYALEKPSAPTSVGTLAGAFGAEYKLQYTAKTRTFGYRRDFALGANSVCAFARESYPVFKALFEQLQKSDTHSIVLKPKVAPAVPAAASEKDKPATP